MLCFLENTICCVYAHLSQDLLGQKQPYQFDVDPPLSRTLTWQGWSTAWINLIVILLCPFRNLMCFWDHSSIGKHSQSFSHLTNLQLMLPSSHWTISTVSVKLSVIFHLVHTDLKWQCHCFTIFHLLLVWTTLALFAYLSVKCHSKLFAENFSILGFFS